MISCVQVIWLGTNPTLGMSYTMDEDNRNLKEDPDAQYVARCIAGDVDAFEILVERHQKQMINIAFRLTGDYEEACEVAQEAFLSAYRAIRKFRGEAKFSTWLTGITINHAKDRLRQMRGRSYYEVVSIDDPLKSTLFPEDGPPSGETSALEQLEQKEIQTKVQGCINALDDERREVLVLRDIEGFSYDEISAVLHIPDGTVKSRLFRARDALKDCLKKVLRDL
jgi:RNA polymerase sigma-70 factor, ECF subfamily